MAGEQREGGGEDGGIYILLTSLLDKGLVGPGRGPL